LLESRARSPAKDRDVGRYRLSASAHFGKKDHFFWSKHLKKHLASKIAYFLDFVEYALRISPRNLGLRPKSSPPQVKSGTKNQNLRNCSFPIRENQFNLLLIIHLRDFSRT